MMSNEGGFKVYRGILEKYTGSEKKIVIPDGVTYIADKAFQFCKTITSITLPKSVKSIGKYAFSCCTNLSRISMEEEVTSLGESVFEGCRKLKTVTIPPGIKSIPGRAFYESGLCSIIIPEGVMEICESAFAKCKNLTSVSLPESLNTIKRYNIYGQGVGVFAECKNLNNLEIKGKKVKLPADVFGAFSPIPAGLIDSIRDIYPFMTDAALKQYIMNPKIWNELDPELQVEIFLGRQGKPLETEYRKVFQEDRIEPLGETILERLEEGPSLKVCNTAGSYMSLFYEKASASLLKRLYARLKENKNGAKAVSLLETNLILLEKLGETIEVDNSLLPIEQKVMSALISEKKSTAELEKQFKQYYGISIEELPVLLTTEGEKVSGMVFAWLLTAHEKQITFSWSSRIDVVAGYKKPGLCPEAQEVLCGLNREVLQKAVLQLADNHLGITGYSKKMFLAYPICRYANEDMMTELTTRAPKWRSHVSGNEAPPLATFRNACIYSESRAAMFFAERYHDLDQYAAVRGTDADTIRDIYLSDIGLDIHGCKEYDLGKYKVIARLQKDMSFLFELPDGKTAKALPKRESDPEKYETAKKDFSDMKKAVRKILKNRGRILLDDFLTGRTRTASSWKESYLRNPILREAAGLIVWSQNQKTFTIRDNDVLDCMGQNYEMSDAPVCVAHPMEMKRSEIDAWQRYFTDHSLKQPFSQIWEPVYSVEDIHEDRYKGCIVEIFKLSGKDKDGIHTFGMIAYSDDFGFMLDDCKLESTSSIYRLDYTGAGIRGETYSFGKFSFEKYTRKVNHIISVLDRITVGERVQKDDLSVMNMMPEFTLEQIMGFITTAQEAQAVNVLAALLEYKNEKYSSFSVMDELTLEW